MTKIPKATGTQTYLSICICPRGPCDFIFDISAPVFFRSRRVAFPLFPESAAQRGTETHSLNLSNYIHSYDIYYATELPIAYLFSLRESRTPLGFLLWRPGHVQKLPVHIFNSFPPQNPHVFLSHFLG